MSPSPLPPPLVCVLCVCSCYLPVVESLLRAGAYPLCKDKDGKMPIDVVGTKVRQSTHGSIYDMYIYRHVYRYMCLCM